MNLRLWIHLFFIQLFSFSGIVLLFLYVLVFELKLLTFQQFIDIKILQIPLYIIIIAFILTLSIVIAVILTIAISSPFDQIRARINWLLLGKYQHEIFRQDIQGSNWLDSTRQTAKEINYLRDRIVELSSDLQEYTAALVFVGEDTKEEIIENERNRIARELHDSVSQQLFAATMMISAIREVSERESLSISSQIVRVEEIIGNAQTEMRALLLHLRPVDLIDQSLDEGIKHLLIELDSKIPLEIHWKLSPIRIESGIEDHLFRIVQEAISNTMRHSKAHRLEVYLTQNINSVQLKIIDDGQGFDIKTAKQKGNYGLRNMEERVKSLGGSLNIISSKDKGTSINIQIPISQREVIK
ncbi:sensor histidine kinase [Aerococcaceae bacterium WGS1372]